MPSPHLHQHFVLPRRGAKQKKKKKKEGKNLPSLSTRVVFGRLMAPGLSRPNPTLHASLPPCTVAARPAKVRAEASHAFNLTTQRPNWWLGDPSRHYRPSKGSAHFDRCGGRPAAWCSDGVRTGRQLVSRLLVRSSMRAIDGHRDNGFGPFSRDTC